MQRVRLVNDFYDGTVMHPIGEHEFPDDVVLPSDAEVIDEGSAPKKARAKKAEPEGGVDV